MKQVGHEIRARRHWKIHHTTPAGCETDAVSSRCEMECGRTIFLAWEYAVMSAMKMQSPMTARPSWTVPRNGSRPLNYFRSAISRTKRIAKRKIAIVRLLMALNARSRSIEFGLYQ